MCIRDRITWTLLHRFYSSGTDNDNFYFAFWGFVPLLMVLLPATVAWRCICADSPSNTDCMTLTRPMGQTALWLGKIVFLFCGIVLPMLIVESTGWAGFQLGTGAWLGLGSGVMLYFGLVIGTVSALTALTKMCIRDRERRGGSGDVRRRLGDKPPYLALGE